MTATKQELADEIASMLDRPSLEAIVEALKSVQTIGYGTVELELKNNDITWWKSNLSKRVDRDKSGRNLQGEL